MVAIKLPDGSVKTFPGKVTGEELARAIGPGLAKAALAMKVDGALVDLVRAIESDASVEIVTAKHPDALSLIRHDAAHVMAEAVQELYPGTQVTFGPATEDGFYYDFARAEPFTLDDLPKIEARMREIVDRDEKIVREVWDRRAAIRYFKDQGEAYKAEWIEQMPEGEEISIYRQGNWLDLCTGPHLPSTGKLGKAFKLMKLSGAYWRGDQRNAQLQRIYGTAWPSEAALQAYRQCEEALRRELDAEPSAATVRTYERIRNAEPGPRMPSGRREAIPATPSLVGRRAEWSRLREAWMASPVKSDRPRPDSTPPRRRPLPATPRRRRASPRPDWEEWDSTG